MKKLLILAIIGLWTLDSRLQTCSAGITNITAKLTVEISGDSTNNVTIKFQQDGSAKDGVTVDSLVWYYAYAKSSGLYTNDFTAWLKDETKAKLQSRIPEKAASDNQITAQKVSTILTTQPDLLSQNQKNQLATIAALLP